MPFIIQYTNSFLSSNNIKNVHLLLEYKYSYNYREGDEVGCHPDQAIFIWTLERHGQ